jgi:biopolymer transport protein ExbB/TolQ
MSTGRNAEVLDAAGRAAARSAASKRVEMQKGVAGVATIASIAPWIGMLGTTLGIPTCFPGIGTEKSTVLATNARLLSGALLPTALGLLVALLALLCYKYLRARLANFDVEMETASLQLRNELSLRLQ